MPGGDARAWQRDAGRLFLGVGALAAAACLALGLAHPAAAKPHRMPSLNVTEVSAEPATVATGEVLTVRARVVNTGRAKSRRKQTRLDVYVRDTASGPNGVQFANTLIGSIAAHSARRVRVELTMPASPTGTFYFAACLNRRGNSGPQRCAVTKRQVILTGPERPGLVPGERYSTASASSCRAPIA